MSAALNGLIREGVITGFELPSISMDWRAAGTLHVVVAAQVVTNPRDPGYDPTSLATIGERVARELNRLGVADAKVLVRRALI